MNHLIPGLLEQTRPSEKRPADRGTSGLGDQSVQLYPFQLARASYGIGSFGLPVVMQSSSKLETLKRKRFTVQGRTERIEKSLAALNQPETLKLTPQEWRFFAEDPDLDDQD